MGHIRRRKALWPNSSMTKLPWLNTLRHTTEEHETDLLSKMENTSYQAGYSGTYLQSQYLGV